MRELDASIIRLRKKQALAASTSKGIAVHTSAIAHGMAGGRPTGAE